MGIVTHSICKCSLPLLCAGVAIHPALLKKDGLGMGLLQGVGAGRGCSPEARKL